MTRCAALSTPEIMSYLTEELAQSAAKGLRNEVFDIKLKSGDIAESWREGADDYATVALRYERPRHHAQPRHRRASSRRRPHRRALGKCGPSSATTAATGS